MGIIRPNRVAFEIGMALEASVVSIPSEMFRSSRREGAADEQVGVIDEAFVVSSRVADRCQITIQISECVSVAIDILNGGQQACGTVPGQPGLLTQ